jgi:dipeptidyl aminopeptidase/acylaminoacyl peptidase
MQPQLSSWDIWRIPAAGVKGGQPSRVVSSTLGECSAHYSPDGKRLVLHSNRSGKAQIWACDADGSHCMQLTFFKKGFSGNCRWFPDGRTIVFQSDAEGNWEVYAMDAQGGKPLRLTANPAFDRAPSWSRDGKWIYFASDRTGRPEVWKLQIGGSPVQVTKNGGYAALESPGGKFIYYTKADQPGPLWKMPVEGGEEKRVVESIYGGNFAVLQRGVYFMQGAEREAALRYLDFSTGGLRTIGPLGGWVSIGLTISPDERWALYSKPDVVGSDLMLVEHLR